MTTTINKYIAFTGLVRDNLGIAMWQADGRGPEPAAIGHTFNTPLYPITAHYYVASRDYVVADASGGVAGRAVSGEWPRLQQALAEHRHTVNDLRLRLPLTTPGPDREGADWFYKDDIETRYLYPQAPLPLLLGNIPLVEFAPRRLILTEDYNNAEAFADVHISIISDPAPERRSSAPAGNIATDLAQALLADLADHPVRFVVDSIHLVAETFSGNGRVHGRFADIPTARLEVL